jgi:predicted dehydrogenase
MPDKVRIGIIGAGGYSRSRHIPGFQKQPNVEVVAVANRSVESAQKVASQFNIPEALDDWRPLIERKDIDAILIGTPPYVHLEMASAAIDAGKHVLCQTRIAPTAAEARAMHEKAEAAKDRGVLTMLVPPGPFFRGRRFVQHLVNSGYTGKLRHVQAFSLSNSFADASTPLTVGRNDPELYGPYHASTIGLAYDNILAWTGPAARVLSQRATFTPERPATEGGPMTKTPYPDEITVLSETADGVQVLNLLNAAVRFGESRFELYGEDGTVVYKSQGDTILGGRKGDEQLQKLEIPPEHDNPWRVEEEFIRLIRGEVSEPSFSFWDGFKNAEYLEAVYVSGTEGRWVDLPLH